MRHIGEINKANTRTARHSVAVVLIQGLIKHVPYTTRLRTPTTLYNPRYH